MTCDKATATAWDLWAKLWNGDLAVADSLISPQFIAHFAPMSPTQGKVRGRESLKQWIQTITAVFNRYQLTTEVGPLVDGDTMAGRWLFDGIYQGGIPGAAPDAIGKQVRYHGIDIFRLEDGQIVEYGLSADSLTMLQQIGVITS